MAVYTHISEAELAAHLVRYDLGTLVSFTGAGEGIENTNYIVTTTAGKYVLTLFEGRAKETDLPFFFAFMAHLGLRGLPVAAPVADKDGHIITRLKDKPAAITTFLNGAWPKEPTVAHCAAMGATLARMHLAADGFTQTRANTMGMQEWRGLIDACGQKANTLEPGLAALLQDELGVLAHHLPTDLPRGAVHADVFPDNVFFDGDKISGVIDFYFACTDMFVYDLMLTLNAWTFGADGTPNAEKGSAFLTAYAKIRPLSDAERHALPLFGRAAALRITATRLYDALHPKPGAIVTPKNPLAHLRILRFHRSVTA